MKTKLEIIEETASYYNNLNRSVSPGETRCYYTHPEDNTKHCALGRCMTEDALNMVMANNNTKALQSLEEKYNDIDSLLREEYRGHSCEFWKDIQEFHDDSANWNDEGLTEKGLNKKQELLFKYAS